MTHLGLTPAEAESALQLYVKALAAIELAFEGAAATASSSARFAGFDDLRFHVEVDVRARSTVEGQVRMSEFERVAIEPGLRALHVGLVEAGAPGMPADERVRRVHSLRESLERLIARCVNERSRPR